jgi:hypothetical protein
MIAGGMESMSSSRHAVHMRPGVKFGDVAMDDTLLKVPVLQLHHVLFLMLVSIK